MWTLSSILWILTTINGISAEKLSGFSHKNIKVPVPPETSRNVPISVSLNLSLSGPVNNPDVNNLVDFSVFHGGHLTVWSVVLQSSQTSVTLNKSLCTQNSSGHSNFIYVAAYSRTVNELQLEVGSHWNEMFRVSLDKALQIDVNPSTTQTFQFYPTDYSDEAEHLLVEIRNRTSSDSCMYVAINPPGCPWHQGIQTIRTSKLWARVLNTGYFTIERQKFPDGFTISFISIRNNSECHSEHSQSTVSADTSKIYMEVRTLRTSYNAPIAISIATLILTGVFFSFVWFLFWSYYRKSYMEEEGEVDGYEMTAQDSMEHQISGGTQSNILIDSLYEVLERFDVCTDSDRDTEEMTSVRAAIHRLARLRSEELSVSDLSHVIRRCVWHRRLRSWAYLLLVPLVSIFYLIPSFQLVYAEYVTAEQLGNIDRCYFNFGCARPLWIFHDFNHAISNCGYIIYGLFFIGIVYCKSQTLPSEQNQPTVDHKSRVGLVQQYSLFYTLGICMVLQGVFSAIFHICPSNTSLQFDTSMMYMMLVLVMIKTFQFRHPDTTTNAFTAMYIFSLLMFLEAASLYIKQSLSKKIFFSICSLTYLYYIAYLSFDNYYYGAIKVSYRTSLPVLFKNLCAETRHPYRLSMMILYFVFNLALIIFIFVKVLDLEDGVSSLSSSILLLCSANVGVYISQYLLRKFNEIKRSKTRSLVRYLILIMFLFFFIVIGLIAGYFYSNRLQSRNLSSAESRNLNQVCGFSGFYDNHDLWHFLSATALFLAFIFLLSIDDDLFNTPREEIKVF